MIPHLTHQELEAMQTRATAALAYEPSSLDPDDLMWEPSPEAEEFEAPCPLCNGNGSTDAVRYDHKEMVGTVCAFGIGEGFHKADEWVRHGPQDVLQLIEWGRSREQLLGELLAQIHGDGGQHLELVGWEQACEDAASRLTALHRIRDSGAEQAVQGLQQERDALWDEVQQLRAALPE